MARSEMDRETLRARKGGPTLPFVTISREAGAGGRSLGKQLVAHLNQTRHQGPQWELYDQRLVEQVSQEHHLPPEWVDMLEERDFSWLSDLFAGLYLRGDTEINEFIVYRRVSETIRRLARRGNVVIVGRGGAYITADLREAVHIRLVAPRPGPIGNLVRRRGLDRDEAEYEMERLDENRRSFYSRYWPGRTQGPENYTVTLNTHNLADQTMVRSVMPLLEEARAAVSA
ncbi:MAG: cytidylate kinase-like family protein [Phycisphaeraceae bacterium]